MSRAIFFSSPGARRVVSLALSAGLLVGAGGTLVVAQDRPVCSDVDTIDCRLPDWSTADERDLPSLFGEVEGLVWLADELGDAPAGGLDIIGVGLGMVDITEPATIRASDALLKRGKAKKAVPSGPGVLLRIVLDRAPDQVEGGHASVHVATDIDGSRSNNVPSGVAAPNFPFSGYQDVYSLTWAATTGKTRLLDSDLAKGWYKDKDPLAASWAAPNVLDVLISPRAFGQSFGVVTHAAGAEGGYDEVSYGPASIPADGLIGLAPVCIESAISTEPFVVRRLTENGQTVRDVEAPASWRGGATLPVDSEIQAALAELIAARDDDADGRVGIPTWVNLFEDGIVIRQRPDLELALDGDLARIGFELGLTRQGYDVLRDFEPEPTGDERVDTWLESATDALRETMPPFRSGKKGGLLVGEGIGSCVPWLAVSREPIPEASPVAADGEAAASA